MGNGEVGSNTSNRRVKKKGKLMMMPLHAGSFVALGRGRKEKEYDEAFDTVIPL